MKKNTVGEIIMESLTKNKQDRKVIEQMVARAFPNMPCREIIELKEGYFNVAYLITLINDEKTILKIAPHPDSRIMSYEKNIMFSEVDSLRLVKKETDVPVPDIIYYDNSYDNCSFEYYFMSFIEGETLNLINDSLSEDEKRAIQIKLGKYNHSINQITGSKFGYYGQPELQGTNWFEVFRNMIQLAYHDANVANIHVPIKEEELLSLLDRDKAYFDEVTVPRLVHWDIWAGNVFIKNKKISGIIDFERCIWADPLLEVGFRSHERNVDFLEGYGITNFTMEQERRARWYDIYLFLVMILETEYRKYETDDLYNWSKDMIVQCISTIR